MARKNDRTFQFKTLLKGKVEKDVNGKTICYPDIVETTNYELLQLLNCNRDVAPAHVQKMGVSVTQLGNVLRDIVVVKINFEYFVADGQHLLGYLKQAELPIRCKLIKAESEKEALKVVTMLNSTSRNWGIKNFVEGWANFNDDVKILAKLKKEFSLTYTTIGALLTNSTSALAKKQITNGDFKVVDMEEAIDRIQAIDHFYNVTSCIRSQYATTGLIDFMGNLGIEKYRKNQKSFVKCVTEKGNGIIDKKTFGRKEDYLEFFNDCWNS
jgi:hypothetical protein